jgi:hypothetical protein
LRIGSCCRTGGCPDRRVGPARWHHYDDHHACGTRRPSRPRQAAIAAGNAIHTFPYVWGGGHRSFTDTGYDCSGAVSYVLHAAGLLASPMPSGPLASSWGTPGKGRWITVYANASHAYMIVAGLRFDTSSGGDRWNQGSGPRWRKKKRQMGGFTAKYAPGY